MEQESLVGQTILGYEVVSQIGMGSFGMVYKAVKRNALGDYTRALKHLTFPTKKRYVSVLNSMGGDTEKTDSYFAGMLNDLASETSLLSSLSERKAAHIVRYYESDLKTQRDPLRYDVYILMEYATPLIDYLEQTPHFTVRDVVEVGLGVLQGIEVCHENGVIHRDIKEDNIFVSSTGEYEIGDFGVSKVLKDSSRAESLKGTPNYLAPEVYLNKKGYTKSVDLYALGIVLYRLLNHGRNPFMPPFPERYVAEDEDNAFEMRMREIEPPAPALGSPAIHEVITKALSSEESRYQDAESFAADLSQALEETSEAELDEEIGYVSSSDLSDAGTLDAMALGSVDQSQQTLKVGIGQGTDLLKPAEKTDVLNASASRICPSCGTVNRGDNNFCKGCGKPLSDDGAQVNPAQTVQTQPALLTPVPAPNPVGPDPTGAFPANPSGKSPKGNTAKVVMLSIASVCGVLAIAVFAFILLNPLGLTTGIFANSAAAYEQMAKESQEAAQTSQEQTQSAQEMAENAQGEANEAQSQLEDIKAQNKETQEQLEKAQEAQKEAEEAQRRAEEAQAQAEAEKREAEERAEQAQAEAAARAQEQSVTTTTTSTTSTPKVQSTDPTPFWGIWTDASKSPDNIQVMAQEARDKGFPGVRIIYTNDWTNLNPEPWYVLTMGTYSSQAEAEAHMEEVLDAGYDEAYINYTGSYVG